MRLDRLSLTNYRRFADATVQFPDGVIGIVGRNGAGKSTLIEAIQWCLFGHDAARTGKDLIKRQGAAPGQGVEVRLEFRLDDASYTLARRLRGKTQQPEAELAADGALLVAPGPNSWDQATLAVERLLGFRREGFEATVVAKQGDVAALSELRPAQRKRLLTGLLGVERVDAAVAACRDDARLIEARLGEARQALADLPRLRSAVDAARAELVQARVSRAGIETQLEPIKDQWEAAARRTEALDSARRQDSDLRGRLQHLQSELEAVWGRRVRLHAETRLLEERAHGAEELRGRLMQFVGLDEALAASEANRLAAARVSGEQAQRRHLAAERDRWARLAARAPRNGSSPETLADVVATLQARARQAEGDLLRLEAELGAAATAGASAPALSRFAAKDPCRTCGRILGAHLAKARAQEAHEAQRQAARVTRLGAEAEDARRWFAQAQAEAVEAQRRLEESRRAADAAQSAQEEVVRLEAHLATLGDPASSGAPVWVEEEHGQLVAQRAERATLMVELARADEAQGRFARLQDEDRLLRAEEGRIQRDREASSRDLRGLAYEAGSFEREAAAVERLRRRMEELERDRVQWVERCDARARDVAALEERVAHLERREGDTKRLMDDLRVLDRLAGNRGDQGLLPEFRLHLLGRIRPALASAASTLVAAMTQGRYRELALDEEFGVQLYDGAAAHPLERFSGGENDVVNLALRLAVSELLALTRGHSRIGFVVLDEVFASQDAARRAAVLDALQSLGNVFRQVLLVTHTDDVRDRLPHVLSVESAAGDEAKLVASWEGKP